MITGYYLHLQRHTRGFLGPAEPDALKREAIDLFIKTFARKGGVKAVLVEAKEGCHGGLRSILGALTETYKSEQYKKQIISLLKQAWDPLDFNARLAFIRNLLQHLAPYLPELASEDPRKYLEQEHFEYLARAYIDAMNKIKELIKIF